MEMTRVIGPLPGVQLIRQAPSPRLTPISMMSQKGDGAEGSSRQFPPCFYLQITLSKFVMYDICDRVDMGTEL